MAQGSSPRVRGRVKKIWDWLWGGGIIPAGAGKRLHARGLAGRLEDHPRGCGEESASYHGSASSEGSSPRVRGRASRPSAAESKPGIIPAGAGKRSLGDRGSCLYWDHPRGCGEERTQRGRSSARRGSSPRVRGRGRGRAKRPPRRRDHPRGCGEELSPGWSARAGRGSSPRVRGRGDQTKRKTNMTGIIPAGAGKSFVRHCLVSLWGDHPRGCGEEVRGRSPRPPLRGSSPRVRGRGTSRTLLGRRRRIIPAGAGKRLR